MSALRDEVEALLAQRLPSGELRYSDAEVRDAIPLLMLGVVAADPDVRFPDFAVSAFGEVSVRASIDSALPADQLWLALERYYNTGTNPLVAALSGLLQRASAESELDVARAAMSVLGVDAPTHVLESGPRPVGTTPAGPAARFALLGRLHDTKK